MTDPNERMVARIEANPKYQELKRKRNSFGWHTIRASQITILCNGNAQITVHASVGVLHLNVIYHG